MGRIEELTTMDGLAVLVFDFEDCSSCGKETCYFERDEEKIICNDCLFKMNRISEKEYLDSCGICLSSARACVHDDEIYITLKGKFEFEKKDNDHRKSKEYKEWRMKVFERDKYTCQCCEKVGGELNAHHLKPFSKYKKLRYVVNNGLTLCVDCHRNVHKKMRCQK